MLNAGPPHEERPRRGPPRGRQQGPRGPAWALRPALRRRRASGRGRRRRRATSATPPGKECTRAHPWARTLRPSMWRLPPRAGRGRLPPRLLRRHPTALGGAPRGGGGGRGASLQPALATISPRPPPHSHLSRLPIHRPGPGGACRPRPARGGRQPIRCGRHGGCRRQPRPVRQRGPCCGCPSRLPSRRPGAGGASSHRSTRCVG
mmetsp:Transcript_91460/g.285076  ORF Transcript_91460/g.285076 Transcript_91460/m.285076 type:complete len:205 (+) Transcript_91460:1721-2335(+)